MKKILKPRLLLLYSAVAILLFIVYYNSQYSKRERWLEEVNANSVTFVGEEIELNYFIFNKDTLEFVMDIKTLVRTSKKTYKESFKLLQNEDYLNNINNLVFNNFNKNKPEHFKKSLNLGGHYFRVTISDIGGHGDDSPFYDSEPIKIFDEITGKDEFLKEENRTSRASYTFSGTQDTFIITIDLEKDFKKTKGYTYQEVEKIFKDGLTPKYSVQIYNKYVDDSPDFLKKIQKKGYKNFQVKILYKDGTIEDSRIVEIPVAAIAEHDKVLPKGRHKFLDYMNENAEEGIYFSSKGDTFITTFTFLEPNKYNLTEEEFRPGIPAYTKVLLANYPPSMISLLEEFKYENIQGCVLFSDGTIVKSTIEEIE